MNVLGATASNTLADFEPVQGTMTLEPQFETNLYLESVLPSQADQPFSFQSANPKIITGKTINGFIPLPPNLLVSTNNTDTSFTPQYDYLRAEGK